ncbi:LOG family protein [Cohnella nanjingensis]|uniref:Cytokinin riboside 5'-monophosphate phosphoribohydrolase n=1 Tax=Cohnella nanjingensis TaxID=1387779 RepID=A0A7X0RSZ4_9BACL|nr:TIGR00730 family Rossman fold protein [Cohnella nanjingensis]MBB6673112.1 TIGR00730 family Rossman fold protein [Cohnella nanjingensis]
MKHVAVFCGSSDGASDVYRAEARLLGAELASRGMTLVYGGASVGLMGAVADAVLEAGGRAVGVLPRFLQSREIAHKGLSELILVDTMHERKAKMAELSDGFIVLPGGPGTMEEFFEIYTWAQLGLHRKPCGILNVNGYYDPLVALFDHMAEERFLQDKHRGLALVDADASDLLDRCLAYEPPTVKTYLTEKQT